MKRQNLLIAACCLAAVSLVGNFWLLTHRNEKPASTPQAKAEPKLPSVDIDFSDTGLSDKAWKLTDDPEPGISLDEPFEGIDLKARDPNNTLDKALLVPPPK